MAGGRRTRNDHKWGRQRVSHSRVWSWLLHRTAPECRYWPSDATERRVLLNIHLLLASVPRYPGHARPLPRAMHLGLAAASSLAKEKPEDRFNSTSTPSTVFCFRIVSTFPKEHRLLLTFRGAPRELWYFEYIKIFGTRREDTCNTLPTSGGKFI